MGVLHFLNVLNGDCSIIQHIGGHVTVIDVHNASEDRGKLIEALVRKSLAGAAGVPGNYQQKQYPVNPIAYMRDFGIESVFRFILTHPDMDHMGGIEDFFKAFSPANFWDTDNTCDKDFSGGGGPHSEDDWKFYKALRDGKPQDSPKRLVLHSDARGKYFNEFEDGKSGGDGLYILAPTEELVAAANESDDYNDASYVLLYRSAGGRIIFGGDSHDATWEHILNKHEADVKDVDILIAPHHGRASSRTYEFLDVLNPKVTFFGNANSEHLAYGAWNSRELFKMTNNQANCMIVDTNVAPMAIYATNERFAKELPGAGVYSEKFKAYYRGTVS